MTYVLAILLLLIFVALTVIFSRLSDREGHCITLLEKFRMAHEQERQAWTEERRDFEAQLRAQEREMRAVLKELGKYQQIVEQK